MEGSAILHVQNPESSSESEYDTDSSEELLSSNIGVQYQSIKITDQDRLEDYTKARSYEDFRNKYFTPQITKHSVSVKDLDTSESTTVTLNTFGIDLTNVIGCKLVKGFLKNSITVSDASHIDIIVPEIPYIACVKNAGRLHLLQRVSVYTTGAVYYENKHLFRDSYFTPINLSTLHISHEGATGGNLEFEITVLNHDLPI